MAVLSRRLFLAVGGSALSTLAFTTKPRRRPLVGDWSPTALWQPTDPWGAH